jgi:hypothetical protein
LTYTGTPGPHRSAYYWVQAIYRNDIQSVASGPYVIYGVPATLNTSNYITISWPAVPDAQSYNVLKTTTPTIPAGTQIIKLANTTSTSVNDTGQALTNHFYAPEFVRNYVITTGRTGELVIDTDSDWFHKQYLIKGNIQLQSNFQNQWTGRGGIEHTFTFPSPRGTNLYYGYRIDIADLLTDGSAGIGIYNTGNADGIFIEARGTATGTTNPTGIAVTMNHLAGAQNNPSFNGYGIQIWDYTAGTTSARPLLVRNVNGSQNPLADFQNTGDGPAIITLQAGSTTDQAEALRFLSRTGAVLWDVTKNSVNDLAIVGQQAGFVALYMQQGVNRVGINTTGPQATLDVNGPARALEIQFANGTQGTCDAANRGRLVFVQGGSGVKDTLVLCAKDATNAYAWRTIY